MENQARIIKMNRNEVHIAHLEGMIEQLRFNVRVGNSYEVLFTVDKMMCILVDIADNEDKKLRKNLANNFRKIIKRIENNG